MGEATCEGEVASLNPVGISRDFMKKICDLRLRHRRMGG